MPLPTPPQAVAVEVVAAQPTETDTALIAQLALPATKDRAAAAYIVKVRLKAVPVATSLGWALYVGELRIPKYWEYTKGIWFKVFDPRFFADHAGAKIRFSSDGVEFIETGLTLGGPDAAPKAAKRAKADASVRTGKAAKAAKSAGAAKSAATPARLPTQASVLK